MHMEDAMFTDMHAHFLPAVDDGASSQNEALAMLRSAAACGTDAIVATPHLFHPERSEPGLTLTQIKAVYRTIKQRAAAEHLDIRLYLGAEVFLFADSVKQVLNGDILTLNGTRNLLVEFDFDERSGSILQYAQQLLTAGYTPVIAHAERYTAIKRDAELAEELSDLGCMIQVNKGSIFGDFGRAAMVTAFELLERECADVVASDAHDVKRRAPDLGKAYLKLSDVCDAAYLTELFRQNPNRLLTK